MNPGEPIFHNSPHEYYEDRPEESNESNVIYDKEELVEVYWTNLALTEFWSKYEVVYTKSNKTKKGKKTKVMSLQNGKGFIRRRLKQAVLRYYLNYNNDEDLARGLLILFKPFRNEREDIHRHDVKELLDKNLTIIQDKRKTFEKYQTMLDLISKFKAQKDNEDDAEVDKEEELEETETTCLEDIEEFNNWAKNQASKDLSKFKNLTDLCDINQFRLNMDMFSLN